MLRVILILSIFIQSLGLFNNQMELFKYGDQLFHFFYNSWFSSLAQGVFISIFIVYLMTYTSMKKSYSNIEFHLKKNLKKYFFINTSDDFLLKLNGKEITNVDIKESLDKIKKDVGNVDGVGLDFYFYHEIFYEHMYILNGITEEKNYVKEELDRISENYSVQDAKNIKDRFIFYPINCYAFIRIEELKKLYKQWEKVTINLNSSKKEKEKLIELKEKMIENKIKFLNDHLKDYIEYDIKLIIEAKKLKKNLIKDIISGKINL